MLPGYEVADILNQNTDQLESITQNRWKLRTLRAIAACRTATLGYHIDQCSNPDCHQVHISYNSCRNRHCPKCQGHKREEWIRKRETELLNIPYYHTVFTLPGELNRLCLVLPKLMYDALFKVAWSVLKDFATNPKFLGAKTGMIAILHTWGQDLGLHPHIHCIIPGGGITASGKWKQAKGQDKYLFPVKSMSSVFRARYVGFLRNHVDLEDAVYKSLFAKSWVVYCKRPFYGPQQVIEYLGRYTHKIAISNHRIKNIENGTVSFSAKNYRQDGKMHIIALSGQEFIRRFALHILPRGFTRIRHYGLLSSAIKNLVLPILRDEMGPVILPVRDKILHKVCPWCKKGNLVTIAVIKPRGPPVYPSASWKTVPA